MKFILVVLLFSSFTVCAQTSELNQIMKKMGHEYKLAIKAQQQDVMITHLDKFIALVEQAKAQSFAKEKTKKSIEGLNRIIKLAEKAKGLARNSYSTEARQALKEIDILREEYHKLHEPPSIWQLLFGN
ncbi:cytochrome b562 [Pseudoalteromonas luteoviolacea]|uniref:Cytochrome b562 n=1 Tax=Pseudoalteromonas luteoviolacea S4054 TaxID=1129367 RepID=A0A0F6A5U9_9GAMM|nr:cytochrome b562 [Pseudoalteromonas luteoviolacea]AOT10532.1 hypothetical protein S4054249_21950 [Pseudoalteromonas luteoviolacea]AOT15400.1 hypothetical protein S40542_21645 [Pseudoalteromonas luteoviolacea]AOT20351.1 hypothetical protein S4054_21865 [Pseudoalteromonas luteoviolacea]KKE81483.1 hypothetical protein N479_03085 [Pseudoalteromonas luteoviolacea S4054]KZN71620.1 hypothetical protein N481_18295 [Pseudoalteromonas luteoviolacea S4047-1]